MNPLNNKKLYHKDDSPREESVVGRPGSLYRQNASPSSDDGWPTLLAPIYPLTIFRLGKSTNLLSDPLYLKRLKGPGKKK